MNRNRACSAALCAVLLVAAPTASSAAATVPWHSWTNTGEGFRVTIPEDWFFVPTSVSRVEADIKQLDKQNDAGLAQAFGAFIGTSQARAQLARYVFEAFSYSTFAHPLVVTVAVVRTKPENTTQNGLLQISKTESSAAAARGWSVSKATVVKLPAGYAALISGRYAVPGSVIDFATYVVARGAMLYALSFTADSRIPEAESTFGTIARLFGFTKLQSATPSPSSPVLKA